MTEEKIKAVQSMIKDQENFPFITDIIKVSGVGRTTFYRHCPPEIIAPLRD